MGHCGKINQCHAGGDFLSFPFSGLVIVYDNNLEIILYLLVFASEAVLFSLECGYTVAMLD